MFNIFSYILFLIFFYLYKGNGPDDLSGMESLNQSLNTSLHIDCDQLELIMDFNLEEQEVKGMENSSNNCYIIEIIQCARTLSMHISSLYDFLKAKNEQLLDNRWKQLFGSAL